MSRKRTIVGLMILVTLIVTLGVAVVPGAAQGNVTSATLILFAWASDGPAEVRVHRVTDAWEEATVTWDSFADSYDMGVEGAFTSGYGWHAIDVTSLVEAWMDGTYPNHGFLLEQDLSDVTGGGGKTLPSV